MSLQEIKNYLMQVKIASLASLSAHFKCDADVLRCMMAHWMKKGCIRQFNKTPACGGACVKCPSQQVEIYEWLEQPIAL